MASFTKISPLCISPVRFSDRKVQSVFCLRNGNEMNMIGHQTIGPLSAPLAHQFMYIPGTVYVFISALLFEQAFAAAKLYLIFAPAPVQMSYLPMAVLLVRSAGRFPSTQAVPLSAEKHRPAPVSPLGNVMRHGLYDYACYSCHNNVLSNSILMSINRYTVPRILSEPGATAMIYRRCALILMGDG